MKSFLAALLTAGAALMMGLGPDTGPLAGMNPDVVRNGETIYIELGDSFLGDFGGLGGTVYANFNGVEGTLLSWEIQAHQMLVRAKLMNSSGDYLDLTGYLNQVGSKSELLDFPLPAHDNYTVEITGTAVGARPSGLFVAQIDGEFPQGYIPATLGGTVINMLTADPLEGAEVHVGPFLLVTDEDGRYSGNLPFGIYEVTFEAPYFNQYVETVTLFPMVINVMDVALEPVAPVVLLMFASGEALPDGTVEADCELIILDGSTLQSLLWTQTYGVPAEITTPTHHATLVELAPKFEYKEELFHILAEPPMPGDEEFHGGLQNRFEVTGLNPFVLEETGLIKVQMKAVTTSGEYVEELEIHTHIPWKPSAGIRNVPIGVPVLLHGKDQTAYNWNLTVPPGSQATLEDATTQWPEFLPDRGGEYRITVTDEATQLPVVIDVYAGTWRGVIVGQDANKRPVSDPSCVNCHRAQEADEFTPWAQTGHAEIFTNNLNTSTHYGPNCFSCHTVGYDPGVANRGFDDAPDYQAFLQSGMLNNPGDNWTRMLRDFPAAAKLANIQCENCHGPQDGEEPGRFTRGHADGPLGARTSLSSDMCATCHGEPLRHARHQQWQLSGHANYELAIDESQSGNCSRCHTGNGFVSWAKVLTGEVPGDPFGDVLVEWTEDQSHPQTCAACHDPHDIGTTSGNAPNAKVRISGNTPPLLAGYRAYGVGKGALCMTCHNSRRGLRNDSTWPQYYQTGEAARAPHGPTQTDLLMGQNAYLVAVGTRGNHSFLTGTCVKCHMEATDPPPGFSYNLGGTNHTFAADPEICADCHTGYEAETIQQAIHDMLDELKALIEDGIYNLIDEQLALNRVIDLNGDIQITDINQVMEIIFTETRGRHAITVVFTGGAEYGPYRMTDIDVLDDVGNVLGQLYDFADPDLIKGGWNHLLVHSDGSFGVHNPSYSFIILAASIEALDPFPRPIYYPEWLSKEWRVWLQNR